VRRIALLIYFISVATFAAAQTRETYADLPGARIWYKDTGGSGMPIVFCMRPPEAARVGTTRFPRSLLRAIGSSRSTGVDGASRQLSPVNHWARC